MLDPVLDGLLDVDELHPVHHEPIFMNIMRCMCYPEINAEVWFELAVWFEFQQPSVHYGFSTTLWETLTEFKDACDYSKHVAQSLLTYIRLELDSQKMELMLRFLVVATTRQVEFLPWLKWNNDIKCFDLHISHLEKPPGKSSHATLRLLKDAQHAFEKSRGLCCHFSFSFLS
jgi:hypothetical protein